MSSCDSCEAVYINGVFCHELGCPTKWKTEMRKCNWCGQEFKPERSNQDCCCDLCAESYYT